MATGECFPLVLLHISDSPFASAAMWMKERANKGLLDDNSAHEMSRAGRRDIRAEYFRAVFHPADAATSNQQMSNIDVTHGVNSANSVKIQSSSCRRCTDDEMMSNHSEVRSSMYRF